MTCRLTIVEFHESFSKEHEFPQERKCFKLIETYDTSDGLRSRLCDGLWATRDEARAAAERRMEAAVKAPNV